MQRIIIKFLLYLSFIILIHVGAAYQAGGKFDPFYIRFTNGRHQSMILGTSRAAQGLNPAVIDSILVDYTSIGNFAFTVANSPYGPVYFDAIRQKIDTTNYKTKKNIFVLAVDPWAISSHNDTKDDINKFKEKNLFLGKLKSINKKGKPNFEYLIKEFPKSWGKILYNPVDDHAFLHENGWLAITVPMDDAAIKKRTKDKISDYQKEVLTNTYSPNRMKYLEKTIAFLKQYGTVYFVRLPVSTEMAAIEKDFMPDFEDKMQPLIKKYNLKYFSFFSQNEDFVYTDGNHLYYQSALKVSTILGNWIAQEDTIINK